MWLIKIQSATGSGVLRFMGAKFPNGKELGDVTNPFTAHQRVRETGPEAKRRREIENDQLAEAFARKYFGVELDTKSIN